jgi:hypothetical protein
MAHVADDNVSRRIWNGDPRPIQIARKAYRDSPNLQTFLGLVSALYSFHFLPWYARELRLLLATDGVSMARELLVLSSRDAERQYEIAVWCDMLVTYLEWASRKDRSLERLARKLYCQGMRYALRFANDPKRAHTYFLLALRRARLHINQHRWVEVRMELDEVARDLKSGTQVADANQRMRILTLLGFEFRMTGWGSLCEGFAWSIRACLVKHTGLLARAKPRRPCRYRILKSSAVRNTTGRAASFVPVSIDNLKTLLYNICRRRPPCIQYAPEIVECWFGFRAELLRTRSKLSSIGSARFA